MWEWTDRFYKGLKAISDETEQHRKKYDQLVTKFNQTVDEMIVARDAFRHDKKRLAAKKANPLLPLAKQIEPKSVPPFPDFQPIGKDVVADILLSGMPKDPVVTSVLDTSKKLDGIERELSRCDALIGAGIDKEQQYTFNQVHPGTFPEYSEEPLDIGDPYELCFALLYLIESGSDLPWMYGPGVGLMRQVAECLPWGILDYSSKDDAAYNKRPYIGKPSAIPDWYERKYKRDDDEFPRSLAQLLYEETGCILPRDLHTYDRLAKDLGKYGVKGKDAVMLLTVMSALHGCKNMYYADNLETDALLNEDEDSDTESNADMQATLAEKNSELKEEIKRLRAGLHAAEKATRETKQELENERYCAVLEHRELADLRELVFNSTIVEEDADDVETTADDRFPYEVKRNTLIFGGHDTWLKAIKPMLQGNARFIDRDYLFDVSIIRNTDVIWVQSNSITHTQYYRIVDTARMYKKPVRYFTNASAKTCAIQVVDNDMQ